MNKLIYKLSVSLIILGISFSCESPEAETNYTPSNYEFPGTVSISTGAVTNSSFNFTYSNSGMGQGYYVVVEGGSDAPSNKDVLNGTADNLIDSGSFELTGEDVTISVDEGLCDGTSYDIYAVQFTSDGFVSPSTSTASVTTTENETLAGTYNVISNGVLSGNFGGGDLTDYMSTVVITEEDDGTFTIDDTTAGFYPDANFYGAFGSPAVPFNFDVPCNSIYAQYASPFNTCCGDFITYDGTINNDGSITVQWESAFGDVITSIYTKQ